MYSNTSSLTAREVVLGLCFFLWSSSHMLKPLRFCYLFTSCFIDVTGLGVIELSLTFVALSPMVPRPQWGVPLCLLLCRDHMLFHFFQ